MGPPPYLTILLLPSIINLIIFMLLLVFQTFYRINYNYEIKNKSYKVTVPYWPWWQSSKTRSPTVLLHCSQQRPNRQTARLSPGTLLQKTKQTQETSVKSGKKHIQGIRAAFGEVDVIVCMNFKHFLRIKKDKKNGHMLSHCKFI